MDSTICARPEALPRLKGILQQAEFGYVGACGYGAKVTLTLADGKTMTLFKGTDDCDSMVFGSYGGYFLGDAENTEFWNLFDMDPVTKTRLETSPATADTRATVFSNDEVSITVVAQYADLVQVDSLYSDKSLCQCSKSLLQTGLFSVSPRCRAAEWRLDADAAHHTSQRRTRK